jgi:hypothetical protein
MGAPLPGPKPETLLLPVRGADWNVAPGFDSWTNGGALLDVRTGAVLREFGYLPIRWAGEDRLLAVGALGSAPHVPLPPEARKRIPTPLTPELNAKVRNDHVAVFTISLDSPSASGSDGNQPLPEPRPPIQSTDRAGLAETTPTPPATWSAPPSPPANTEKLVGAIQIPTSQVLMGNMHASFLNGWTTVSGWTNGQYTQPKGIYWHRFDLRTGTASGPAIQLLPWVMSPTNGQGINLAEVMVAAALSPDGSRLAFRDPADLGRVDVWDESGKRILGIDAYGRGVPTQWVGWSQLGRLLTLGDGRLTAWDVPAGKAVFEVAGEYRLPVAPVRGRAWLAVVGAAEGTSHVDLLETDTGRCLGRLPLTGAELPDTYPDLAISPDGKLLAYVGQRTDSTPAQLTAMLLAWDLTSGKAHAPLPITRVQGWSIVALDEHRVLIGGQMIDLRCRIPVARYSCHCPADSPDGRLWGLGPIPEDEGKPAEPWDPNRDQKMALRPVELVAYDTGPASPQEVFTPQMPLTIEVDLAKKERGEILGQEQVALLQKRGFTIGKSKWRLRAETEVFDSGNRFTNRMPIPGLHFRWRFLTPEDTETWKNERMILFDEVEDKFQVGQRRTRTKGPLAEDVIEDQFNFGGNPREAIIDALRDKAAHYTTADLPRQNGKFNGKYQELPALGEVRFPPMSQ